ncbi:MAG: hypothetical protein U1F50_16360 [Rubrivivax sp.]
MLLTAHASGIAATLHASGSVDTSGPFFRSLGSNGRSCNSCHDAPNAGDIGRFKGPVLRALAARATYFHNGMVAVLHTL